MDTAHKAELEEANKATEEARKATEKAVAAKAAEIVGAQTQEAVKEPESNAAEIFASVNDYWDEYNRQSPGEKHAWHKANKHLLPK